MKLSTLGLTMLFLLISPHAFLGAATAMPGTNCRPVTTAEIAAGFPAGSVRCDTDRAIVPDESIVAKQYLKSILCSPDGDNYGGMGAEGTINNLNPGFATCAQNFLKAAQASGIPVCIKEGARSVAKQNEYVERGVIACKRGAACEHPSGIAIDLNTNSPTNYKKLHENACNFGLDFYLGFKDRYHFVPASQRVGKETSCSKVVANCTVAGFQPNTQSGSFTASQPGNGIVGSALRNLFGGQQDQCQQLSTQCTSGNSSACMQYAQSCSQAPAATAPSMPSGTNGSGAPAQNTQSIGSAYEQPTPSATFAPPSTATTSTSIAATSAPVTTLDPLEQILISTDLSTTSTTTATTTHPLSSTTITYLSQEKTTLSEITSRPVPTTQKEEPFTIPSTPARNTFESENPFLQGSSGSLSEQDRSAFSALLSEARSILEGLLAYVQPFSGRRYEETEWYEEYEAQGSDLEFRE